MTFLTALESQGAKPNSTEDLNFHNAREERNVYQADHDKKKDQAYARFTRDEKRGLTNGMNFDRWVDNGHAPDYTMARNQLTAIGSRIAEIQREVGGRNYAPVDSARQKLNWGLNITSHYAG